MTLNAHETEIVHLKTNRVKMRSPVFLQGRPIHPKIIATVPVSVTGTGLPADRADVEAQIMLPDPTYTWRATEIAGDTNRHIGSWAPTQAGGPSWTSVSPAKPRLVRYRVPTSNLVYSKALIFYPGTPDYMELSMAHAQPGTWVLIGTFFVRDGQHHHILDAEDSATGRHFIHLKKREMQIHGGARLTTAFSLKDRPAVVAARFDGANSILRYKARGYTKTVRGNAGTDSPDVLRIGVQKNNFDSEHGSHMLLFEVQYYDHGLTLNEMRQIEDYAFTRYAFHKW